MRGITPVVSVVLLLLIAVAVIASAFIIFSSIIKTTGETSEEQAEHESSELGKSLRIDNIEKNRITVRNTGSANLSNLIIFVDNVITSFSPNEGIGVGVLKVLNLSFVLPAVERERDLRISADKYASAEDKINLLFFDEFDDGDSNGWTDIGGSVSVSGSDIIFDCGCSVPHASDAMIFLSDSLSSGWTDYTIDSIIMAYDAWSDFYMSVLFRYQDVDQRYECGIGHGDGSNNALYLYKWDGTPTEIARYDPFDAVQNTWYNLKVDVSGNRIKCKVWGVGTPEPGWMIEVTDSSYSSGKVGFYVNGAEGHVDEVVVY
jgi:hypothetical protein